MTSLVNRPLTGELSAAAQAVGSRLTGAAPLGVAFSGGVDSSVLLALAVRALGADQVFAVGNGVYVVAGPAQQDRDLRRQLLVQDGSHLWRACSPAAAAARPRSYSVSLSSISRSISSRYSL